MDSIAYTNFWFGQQYSRTFTWRSGMRWQYTNWDSSEPDGDVGCVYISVATQHWRDGAKTQTRQSICEKPAVEGACETGWHFYAGECLWFDAELRQCEDAAANCQAMGGRLAEIESASVHSALVRLMGTEDAWVGGVTPGFGPRLLDGLPFESTYAARWSAPPIASTSYCGHSAAGTWSSQSCVRESGIVCKQPSGKALACANAPGSSD